MKEFKKNDIGLYICEECGLLCKSKKGLGPHIVNKHNSKEYFDKWIKDNDDGICKICGNNTEYINTSKGYKNCCSKKCNSIYCYNLSKKGVNLKYNCDNVFQLDNIKEKSKQTKLERYDDINYVNYEKTKQTKLERYNDEYYNNKEKRKETNIKLYNHPYYSNWEKGFQTNLEKTGFKYSFQSEVTKLKSIQTLKDKYGVENCQQIPNIHNKSLKTSLKMKKFRNTNLWYQGTYELDFLNKFFDKYNDIKRGPSIKYNFNNNIIIYHADFLIPSLNLIIEVKSSYWYNKNKEKDDAKKEGTLKEKYNYIMILDKKYENFLNYI